MLELLMVLLLLSWLGGFAFDIGGNIIHALLVLAVVLFAIRIFRRSAA